MAAVTPEARILFGEMRTAFLVGNIAYLSLYVVLLAARRAARAAERRLAAAHDLALDTGILE